MKFAHIEALVLALGGQVREGAGSRVALQTKDSVKHAHRPHPGKDDCANTGRAPEPPPSGDLTLHLDPETHGAILAAASAVGKRPDQWAAEQLATAAGRGDHGSALPRASIRASTVCNPAADPVTIAPQMTPAAGSIHP